MRKRAFGVSSRTFILGYVLGLIALIVGFTGGDGALHNSKWALFLAVGAGVTLVVLTVAVTERSLRLLLWCYQALFFMFMYRALAVVIVEPYDAQAAILSLGWAALAGGSYLLHQEHAEGRKEDQ
jgi:hypothetical protein